MDRNASKSSFHSFEILLKYKLIRALRMAKLSQINSYWRILIRFRITQGKCFIIYIFSLGNFLIFLIKTQPQVADIE